MRRLFFSKSLTILLLSFIPFYISGQSANPLPIDAYNITLDSLLNWLASNLQNPNIDSLSYCYAHIALNRAIEMNDLDAKAEVYYSLAEWHNFHANFFGYPTDSAVYYDQKAIELFIARNNMEAAAQQYYFLGLDLAGLNRYAAAEQATFTSIAIYDSLGNDEMVARNYIQLCNTYLDFKDASISIEYGEEAINCLHQLDIHYFDGTVHTYLALAYQKAEQYEKAVQTANKSIQAFEKKNGEERYWNNQYLENYNIKGTSNLALGNHALALKHYQYVLEISKKYNKDLLYAAYFNIAEVLRVQKNYPAALAILNEALTYKTTNNIESSLIFEQFALTYEAMGKYKTALAYKNKVEDEKFAHMEEQIKILESELLVKYETEQKDATIQIQSTQIKQQRQIQQLSFGIGGLLILLLLGLFLTYRRNKKTNALLKNLNSNLDTIKSALQWRGLIQDFMALSNIYYTAAAIGLEIGKNTTPLRVADSFSNMTAQLQKVSSDGDYIQAMKNAYEGLNADAKVIYDVWLKTGTWGKGNLLRKAELGLGFIIEDANIQKSIKDLFPIRPGDDFNQEFDPIKSLSLAVPEKSNFNGHSYSDFAQTVKLFPIITADGSIRAFTYVGYIGTYNVYEKGNNGEPPVSTKLAFHPLLTNGYIKKDEAGKVIFQREY